MKRFFSFLIAAAMVLSLLPTIGLQVSAEQVTEGDGTTAQAPVFIDSEEEWVYYLNNTTGFAYKHETQNTWYFRLTADIVLDAVDEENGDTVNGTVGYTSTGKTTVIDLDGHTVTANGGTARFMAANSAGSSVTLKNGAVIVNRTGTSNNGSVFFINAGSHLTLENMTVAETGTSKYTGTGELLYIGTSKSSATIKNTVLEADTANSSKDNAIYVNTGGASLDIQDSTIEDTVHVTTTGIISVSGATKLAHLNLAFTASAKAMVEVGSLSAGASICVSANGAFTAAGNEANAAYFRTADEGMTVSADADGVLRVAAPAAHDAGTGTREDPFLVSTEQQWIDANTAGQSVRYIKLLASIVLDSATADDDGVNGAVAYTTKNAQTYIDFNRHTVTANGGNTRFYSAATEDAVLEMKNGYLLVNRTYNLSYGMVFNINNGGKLTLQDMSVTEQGDSEYAHNGELLYIKGTVKLENCVIKGEFTSATNDMGPISLQEGSLELIGTTVWGENDTAYEKGGVIVVYGNCQLSMTNSAVYGGKATQGGCIYSNGTVTLENSTVSGGTADSGADIHIAENGTLQLDAASSLGDGASYDLGIAEGGRVTAPCGALVVNADAQALWLKNTQAAIAACTEGSHIKLVCDSTLVLEEGSRELDLSGKNAVLSGAGTWNVKTSAGTFEPLTLGISGVSFRPSASGIYYRAKWSAGENLQTQIATFGVAVSLQDMPGVDFETAGTDLWTQFAGPAYTLTDKENTFQNDTERTSAIIAGILRSAEDGATADRVAKNGAYAEMDIYAAAYITFADGSTVVSGEEVAWSLRDVMQALDTQERYEANKEALDGFYADWESVMSGWNLTWIGK